jgi:hypothetical protein
MRRILVVANQTLGGLDLENVLRSRIEREECSVFVVVPATTPSSASLTWTEGECVAAAQERLAAALRRIGELGAVADGVVGDMSPLLAVLDAIRVQPDFEELIVSTLPAGVSRWLGQDLPNRLRRVTGLSVTHVEAIARAAKAS